MTTPTLRGSSRSDLLALPAILLGFQPMDSAVALGFQGATARFAARFDLGLPPHELPGIAAQVLAAGKNIGGCEVALLAYGDVDQAMDTIEGVRSGFGAALTSSILIQDGDTTWAVDDEGWAVQFYEETSGLAAEAVFHGLPILQDRAAAVAPVEERSPLPSEDEEFVRARMATLTTAGALDLLGSYAESMSPLSEVDALFLALLLGNEDCLGAVFTRLSAQTAEAMWPNLAAARRVAPADVEGNVLSLLGLASWLSGRGAAQTSCLVQLEATHPEHALLPFVRELHHGAVPPQQWSR